MYYNKHNNVDEHEHDSHKNNNNKKDNTDNADVNENQDQGSWRRGMGPEAQTRLEPQVRFFISLFLTILIFVF